MKYFTPGWWENPDEHSGKVAEAYSAYLATVREQLPTALVAFQDDYTVRIDHAGVVESLACGYALVFWLLTEENQWLRMSPGISSILLQG